MADIELVIKIPEEIKTSLKWGVISDELIHTVCNAIWNGTPLPKGHGRLKDIDWIDDNCPYYYSDEDARLCYSVNDVNEAPTVIEADTGREK